MLRIRNTSFLTLMAWGLIWILSSHIDAILMVPNRSCFLFFFFRHSALWSVSMWPLFRMQSILSTIHTEAEWYLQVIMIPHQYSLRFYSFYVSFYLVWLLFFSPGNVADHRNEKDRCDQWSVGWKVLCRCSLALMQTIRNNPKVPAVRAGLFDVTSQAHILMYLVSASVEDRNDTMFS